MANSTGKNVTILRIVLPKIWVQNGELDWKLLHIRAKIDHNNDFQENGPFLPRMGENRWK
jgi:hypothetical protein